MHPALSVIFFTTLSGAGYGLLALLALVSIFDLLQASPLFWIVAFTSAFTLFIAGLLSSALHLRHPDRAWRALSQWRSSWLSREGVAALLGFGPMVALALVQVLQVNSPWLLFGAGILTLVMALFTVFCTSMIYASLKTIRHWNHPYVAPLYLLFSISTGTVLGVFLLAVFDLTSPVYVLVCGGLIISSGIMKYYYWRSVDSGNGTSTMGTATGLGSIGEVRQLDAPHSSENWVMKEMGYRIARKHSRTLRRLFFAFAGILPLILLFGIVVDILPVRIFAGISVVSMVSGVFAERWLFFAEARHVVGLYYGKE